MAKLKFIPIIITLVILSGCMADNPSTNEGTTTITYVEKEEVQIQNYTYPEYGFSVIIPDQLEELKGDSGEDSRFETSLNRFMHVDKDPTLKSISSLTIAVDDEIPSFPSDDEDLPTGAGVSEVTAYKNTNSLSFNEVMVSDEGWITEIVWTKVNDQYIHFYFNSHAVHESMNLDTNQYKEEIINSLTLLEE